MTAQGCPCTYGPDVTLALHDGHCCYLHLDTVPRAPDPLPCGHDDSAVWADEPALPFEETP